MTKGWHSNHGEEDQGRALGSVAAGHPDTATAAHDILLEGGNAIDAAIEENARASRQAVEDAGSLSNKCKRVPSEEERRRSHEADYQ